MLLLQTYVDESGHSSDPAAKIVTVAGGVTPETKWRELEVEWRGVLKEFGVKVLHMKHYAHSQGEYVDWKYKEPKRQAFLGCLVEAIERHVDGFTGASVNLEGFRSLTTKQQEALIDPYFPCLQVALMGAALEAWWLRLPPTDPVQVVIADHPEFQAKARGLYEASLEGLPDDLRIHLAPIVGFGSPSRVVQLQVADLLAYELNRVVTDGVYRPGANVRWAMRQFLKFQRFNFLYFDRVALLARMPNELR